MKQEELLKECPACNSKNISDHSTVKDHSVSKEIFELNKCSACTLIFTNPRPSEDNLGSYYESEDYISHTNRKDGLFEKAYHVARNYMLNQKWKTLKLHCQPNRLLDIGAGTGAFASFAKSKGANVFGVEPSPKAREIAEQALEKKLSESIHQVSEDDLDCITMWHVLEHVPTLNKDLEKTQSLLKDDGLLVIAVPNIESYDAKYYGTAWAALDVPRHLYHFSKKSLVETVSKHGFQLLQLKNMPLDSFYVSLLSEKYTSKTESKFNAMKVALKSNLKGRKSKNQSSIIYVFKKGQF